jgi:hypothetical protein
MLLQWPVEGLLATILSVFSCKGDQLASLLLMLAFAFHAAVH